MNELSAPRQTQVSGTGDFEVSNGVRATHSDWNGSTIEVKEQSRRSSDFSTRMRAAIALGGLEKTYTVSCHTTIIIAHSVGD